MASEVAQRLAAEGFKVFPIAAGAKFPPLWKDWPAKASATIPVDWPANANVGIHCDGLLVIDVDPKKGGIESLGKIADNLPATRSARTPSEGFHLYYRCDAGVRNSVGLLGPGLDVRSKGGYVVAPGSRLAEGAYSWVDETQPIADAPDWLIEQCGAARERSVQPDPQEAGPVASAAVVESARAWLAGRPGAVEGNGGDHYTFATVCELRDRGLSEAQALEEIQPWNDTCSPPWSPRELKIKVRNAYRYAENPPGAKVAREADFPLVPDSGPIVPKSGIRAQRLSEFAGAARKRSGYLVKGLLQRASYAIGYGPPGKGKTFVKLDLAYHVAAGLDWHGRKVHTGLVLYLAYEGIGGLQKRALALRQKYGEKDVPLYVHGAAFNLRDLTGRAQLGELLAGLPEKPSLIVVDTFARALMGGDENSAQDVGAFNSAVAALIESTGACVLLVHHSGKDKSKGARGSSALLGAIDTEFEIDDGRLQATKQRDIELGEPVGFKLHPVVVGIDEDGDEETSCVVEPAKVVAPQLGRLAGNAKRGFDALCSMAPDNHKVGQREWRDACAEFLGERGAAQRFYDIKKLLLSKGFIEVDDQGFVTRKMT